MLSIKCKIYKRIHQSLDIVKVGRFLKKMWPNKCKELDIFIVPIYGLK